jgi:hypothetical protein
MVVLLDVNGSLEAWHSAGFNGYRVGQTPASNDPSSVASKAVIKRFLPVQLSCE